MHTISILALILSIFASRVFCSTRFLRPPEWNFDADGKAGMAENIQYAVGDTIQLLWETHLDEVELYLVQRIGSTDWDWILDCRIPRDLLLVYAMLTRVFSISY